MTKKKLYKSVLKIEVLSEEPLPDDVTLNTTQYEINQGDWSGLIEWDYKNAEIVGAEAVNAVQNQGSDPEFFQMDEDGNEMD